MIITRTPYRISIFGDETGLPSWYLANSGTVVSLAINKYSYVTLRELPPFFHNRFRLSYSKIELANSTADIEHPAIREGFREYANNLALELLHLGELPAKSGIGSSSAFTVGMIHALKALQGVFTNPQELAEEAIAFERDKLAETVGSQDQITSSFGGINLLKFGVGNQWSVEPIKLSPAYRQDFESCLVLLFSGIKRISPVFSNLFSANRDNMSSLMHRTEQLALEFYALLSQEGSLNIVGEMLNESWKIKKILHPSTITASVEEFIQTGIENGAEGGKALGNGGGGFFLFWVNPNSKEDFIKRMSSSIYVPVQISLEGTTRIL